MSDNQPHALPDVPLSVPVSRRNGCRINEGTDVLVESALLRADQVNVVSHLQRLPIAAGFLDRENQPVQVPGWFVRLELVWNHPQVPLIDQDPGVLPGGWKLIYFLWSECHSF